MFDITNAIYTDADKAREHLESIHWPNGPICPHCGNIDPARISATGLSEGQPVTAAADCPDSLSRARLIECLQPDRRVEIEVTGTR